MKCSEVFKNLIVDYYFLIRVETKVLQSMQKNIQKLFMRKIEFKAQLSLRSSVLRSE